MAAAKQAPNQTENKRRMPLFSDARSRDRRVHTGSRVHVEHSDRVALRKNGEHPSEENIDPRVQLFVDDEEIRVVVPADPLHPEREIDGFPFVENANEPGKLVACPELLQGPPNIRPIPSPPLEECFREYESLGITLGVERGVVASCVSNRMV